MAPSPRASATYSKYQINVAQSLLTALTCEYSWMWMFMSKNGAMHCILSSVCCLRFFCEFQFMRWVLGYTGYEYFHEIENYLKNFEIFPYFVVTGKLYWVTIIFLKSLTLRQWEQLTNATHTLWCSSVEVGQEQTWRNFRVRSSLRGLSDAAQQHMNTAKCHLRQVWNPPPGFLLKRHHCAIETKADEARTSVVPQKSLWTPRRSYHLR